MIRFPRWSSHWEPSFSNKVPTPYPIAGDGPDGSIRVFDGIRLTIGNFSSGAIVRAMDQPVSRAFFSGYLSEVLYASFTPLAITCRYWECWTHISSTASPQEGIFPLSLGARLRKTRKYILDFRFLATVCTVSPETYTKSKSHLQVQYTLAQAMLILQGERVTCGPAEIQESTGWLGQDRRR